MRFVVFWVQFCKVAPLQNIRSPDYVQYMYIAQCVMCCADNESYQDHILNSSKMIWFNCWTESAAPSILDVEGTWHVTIEHCLTNLLFHEFIVFLVMSSFKVVLWSKNRFLFFLQIWKCVRLTPNWQNFELWVLSEGCLFWV